MTWLKKWYVWLPFIIIVIIFFYFFTDILIYILIALIISLMGHPIVRFLDSLQFKKIKIPHFLSALLSLIIVISVLLALVLLIVPVIINQAQYLTTVDLNGILDSLREPMASLDIFLRKYGLIDQNESIENIVFTYMGSFLNSINIKSLAGDLLGMAGKLSVGLFSVIFFSYFFMRDDQLLYKGLTTFTPRDSHDEIARILFYSKKMLSRYFLGLFAELLCVTTIISIGMYIIGLENAVFIGVLAGIFNIIPYIGPLIGGAIGCIIGLTTLSPDVFADQSGMLVLQMIIVFVSANLIDEFVLQPSIFSRSVKAHPIEIFIIILMAGTLFGPIGMVLAIPAYTLLRIIAIEFFSHWDFVRNLTQNLNDELKNAKENKTKMDE